MFVWPQAGSWWKLRMLIYSCTSRCSTLLWFWDHPSLCLQHFHSLFGAADATADLTAHINQNLWCFNWIRNQCLTQKPVSRQSCWLLLFYASSGYAMIYSWVPMLQPCICGFQNDGFVVAVCSQIKWDKVWRIRQRNWYSQQKNGICERENQTRPQAH